MSRRTKFQQLKARLLAARSELDEIGHVGPNPSTDPDGAREWRVRYDGASENEREALFGLDCLCPVDASADELAEACDILGYDVEKSPTDLAFWARGARKLERSEWSIGQEVEITGPMRMAERYGDPMVMGHDAFTGRKGRITGMTPDGQNVYLTCLDGYNEDVYVGRILALEDT